MEKETIGKQDAPKWTPHPSREEIAELLDAATKWGEGPGKTIVFPDTDSFLAVAGEERNSAGVSWRDYATAAVDSARCAAKAGLEPSPVAQVLRTAQRLKRLALRNRKQVSEARANEAAFVAKARQNVMMTPRTTAAILAHRLREAHKEHQKRRAAALRAWKTRRANAKKRARAKR
jgi:hypothetical protein